MGVMVKGSWHRVEMLMFRVQGLGTRVPGSGFRIVGRGFKVWGFRSRESCVLRC